TVKLNPVTVGLTSNMPDHLQTVMVRCVRLRLLHSRRNNRLCSAPVNTIHVTKHLPRIRQRHNLIILHHPDRQPVRLQARFTIQTTPDLMVQVPPVAFRVITEFSAASARNVRHAQHAPTPDLPNPPLSIPTTQRRRIMEWVLKPVVTVDAVSRSIMQGASQASATTVTHHPTLRTI